MILFCHSTRDVLQFYARVEHEVTSNLKFCYHLVDNQMYKLHFRTIILNHSS
uniref:Uncharacterized protein n=1 Tax=Lepeophtheirus salmonis TaxID=72036 RepID=A0A0K2TVI0_LEPSM